MVRRPPVTQTVFRFVVLHRADEPPQDLAHALQAAQDGAMVGAESVSGHEEVPAYQVKSALLDLGNDGTFFDEDEDGEEPFNYGAPDDDGIEVDRDSGDEPIVAVYRSDTLSGIVRDLAGRVQRRLWDGDDDAAHPLAVYVKVDDELHRAYYRSQVEDGYVMIYVAPPSELDSVPPIAARFPVPGGSR